MVVYTHVKNDINYIHIMKGPESDIDVITNGRLELDITSSIRSFADTSLPYKLLLVDVNSEIYASQIINEFIQDQKMQHVAKNTEIYIQDMLKKMDGEKPTTSSDIDRSSYGQYVEDGQCPKCKTDGIYIKRGYPSLCKSCLDIEAGKGNIEY